MTKTLKDLLNKVAPGYVLFSAADQRKLTKYADDIQMYSYRASHFPTHTNLKYTIRYRKDPKDAVAASRKAIAFLSRDTFTFPDFNTGKSTTIDMTEDMAALISLECKNSDKDFQESSRTAVLTVEVIRGGISNYDTYIAFHLATQVVDECLKAPTFDSVYVSSITGIDQMDYQLQDSKQNFIYPSTRYSDTGTREIEDDPAKEAEYVEIIRKRFLHRVQSKMLKKNYLFNRYLRYAITVAEYRRQLIEIRDNWSSINNMFPMEGKNEHEFIHNLNKKLEELLSTTEILAAFRDAEKALKEKYGYLYKPKMLDEYLAKRDEV